MGRARRGGGADVTAYSGFTAAVGRWGTGDTAAVKRKLEWQRVVGGNTQKIKMFQEVVGALQEFEIYLLIKPGSAFVMVMVLHSPTKFVAISGTTQHLQGHFIGFVGDRTMTKDPTPVLLPRQKTWKWDKFYVSTDVYAMTNHYEDPDHRGKFWTPPLNGGVEEVVVPLLLAILCTAGKGAPPHAARSPCHRQHPIPRG